MDKSFRSIGACALTLAASAIWSGAAVQVAEAQVGSGLRAPTATILGLVVDRESRRGIEGVAVQLGDATAVTDDRGRFQLTGLEGGRVLMTTRMIGFQTRRDSVDVLPNQSIEVFVPMERDPVELAPIRVTVRSRVLERHGFFGRRESGYAGHFFTHEDVAERDPRTLTELLRPLPGVRLMRNGIEGDLVVFERAINLRGGGLCQPALFLDGVKSQIRMYDAILDPSHIEGVEIYTGAAIPGRYNDPCGAVLVWTRVP